MYRNLINIKMTESGINQYYDFSNTYTDDILEIIRSRERFKEVSSLISKLDNIDTDTLDKYFSNKYIISANDLNDARIAMYGIYSRIFFNSSLKRSLRISVMRSQEMKSEDMQSSFWDDDDIDEDSGTVEDVIDSYCLESDGINISAPLGDFADVLFVLCNKVDSKSKLMLEEDGYIYIKINKDKSEQIYYWLIEKLEKTGYTVHGLEDKIKRIIEMSNADEYHIDKIIRQLIQSSLMMSEDTCVICEEAVDSIISRLSESCSGVTGANLVGLKSEREKLNNIIKKLKLEKKRFDEGISDIKNGCNMVFVGPPGTAKTTLAREFALSLADMGIIPNKGNFIECRKSDIVGKVVGETADKVDMMFGKLAKSGGGVIFFDEIYTLTEDCATSYDKECVTCIVQNMENFRSSVYCIFAGYENKMIEFLSANPGMRSRIQYSIKFQEYSFDELCSIFKAIAKRNKYKIESGSENALKEFFEKLKNIRKECFGNGREARNLFENAVGQHASNIVDLDNADYSTLTVITSNDILEAAQDILSSEIAEGRQPLCQKIGFLA